MKIKFERSGGFTGITNSCVVDSEQLSSYEQKYLQEFLRDIENKKTKNLFVNSGRNDCLQYKILVEDGKKFAITTDELTMDPNLRVLIDFLETRL